MSDLQPDTQGEYPIGTSLPEMVIALRDAVAHLAETNRKLRAEIRCLHRRLRDANRGAERNAYIRHAITKDYLAETNKLKNRIAELEAAAERKFK